RKMPPVNPVPSTAAMFHLVRLPGGDGMPPPLKVLLPLFRMQKFQPAGLGHFSGRAPREFQPALVQVIDMALGSGGEYFLRHRLGLEAGPLRALLDFFPRFHLRGNIVKIADLSIPLLRQWNPVNFPLVILTSAQVTAFLH